MQNKMRWRNRSGKDMDFVKCCTDRISGGNVMPRHVGSAGVHVFPNEAGMMLDDEMVPYRRHPSTSSCMFARLQRPLVITTSLVKTHYYRQIIRTMAGIPTPIPKLKLNDGEMLLPRL